MSPLFHRVDGAQIVIRRRGGIYQQVELYARKGLAYARAGGGFVRLQPQGGTSSPNISWDPDEVDLADSGVTLDPKGMSVAVIGPVEGAITDREGAA